MFSRLIVLLLVLFISFVSYGQKSPRKSTQSTVAKSNIKQIDFLNFTFTSSLCSRTIGKTVRVKRGQYNRGGNYFGVVENKVFYGDLTGDGKEEAIVPLACGMTASTGTGMHSGEFHIYTMQNGRAVMLARINYGDINKDYTRYYDVSDDVWDGIFHETRIKDIKNATLTFKASSGGNRASPEYIVTIKYRWNGACLVLDGKPSRERFTDDW